MQVKRGTETKTLPQAQAAGWLEDFLWGWRQDPNDPNKGSYYLVYDSSIIPGVANVMEPWKGYWIKAHVEYDLILPPPSGAMASRALARFVGGQVVISAKVSDESGVKKVTARIVR